jgi:hypothetical protein
MGRLHLPRLQQISFAEILVMWDLHWHVLERQRLKPATDLSDAMAATIERLADEGWQAEVTPEYGFVFIRREGERRLLMLTPRDPYDTAAQSFNPFRL